MTTSHTELTLEQLDAVSGGKFASDPSAYERMVLSQQEAAGLDPIAPVIAFFTPKAIQTHS